MWTLTTSTDAQFTLICDPLTIPCTGDYLLYSLTGDTSFTDAPQAVCGYDRKLSNISVLLDLIK